jgi:hypothetical protein
MAVGVVLANARSLRHFPALKTQTVHPAIRAAALGVARLGTRWDTTSDHYSATTPFAGALELGD